MALSTMRTMRAAPGQSCLPERFRTAGASRWPHLPFGCSWRAAMLVASGTARSAMYKWVDEKGVVHYTDKMPPEAVDKASVELNKQGVPINRTEKALTPEQRRAIEQEAERAKEAARAQEEINRRDRALVSSYTSEAEIDLARNRSLQTINNVISSSQAFSEQLTKRKVDVEAKKAESQGKPIVAVLDRELESIDAELARQSDLIAQKQKEVVAITREVRRRQAALARARRRQGDRQSPPLRRRAAARAWFPWAVPPRSRRARRRAPRRRSPHAAFREREPRRARACDNAAPSPSGIAGTPWLNTFTR